MAKIKEDLKEKLRRGLKKISKQVLSSDKLTEVSGGDGVREFVLLGDNLVSASRKIGMDMPDDVAPAVDGAHVKVEVKDGVITFRVHHEMRTDDLFKMGEELGWDEN